MRNAHKIGILLILLAAGSLPCWAANAPGATAKAASVDAGLPHARRLLDLMDTDRNGKVSREEFMRFMAEEFDRLDINKDGMLDVHELDKLVASLNHPVSGPGR